MTRSSVIHDDWPGPTEFSLNRAYWFDFRIQPDPEPILRVENMQGDILGGLSKDYQ